MFGEATTSYIEVLVNDEVYKGTNIVIATDRPAKPNIQGNNSKDVITLRNLILILLQKN